MIDRRFIPLLVLTSVIALARSGSAQEQTSPTQQPPATSNDGEAQPPVPRSTNDSQPPPRTNTQNRPSANPNAVTPRPVPPAAPDRTTRPPSRPPTRRPPTRRRSLRVARAPNMFGDFFNTGPTLVFSQPVNDTFQSGNGGPTTTEGTTSNPNFGGGPRLKISDNFSPIPRHRIYVQGHYFRNLFSTSYKDSHFDGGISGDRSAWVTTFGIELLSPDESSSIELRLPLISAPTTNNSLSDFLSDDVGSQSSRGGDVANLSIILKHVINQGEDHFLSGGIGLNVPTADDVTGNIGRLNYSLENGTTNLVPFLAALFRPQQNLFIQVHAQVDVPLGGDDFNYSEMPGPGIITARSGRFGTYRESVLGSVDLQIARQLYAARGPALVQAVTGVIEFRLTQALSPSGSVEGSAAQDVFSGEDVVVDFAQDDPTPTYLNFTFGVQTDLSNNWHLRVGEVIPLIDNGGFTAETMIQLEKRL